jgi:hypothetical protein
MDDRDGAVIDLDIDHVRRDKRLTAASARELAGHRESKSGRAMVAASSVAAYATQVKGASGIAWSATRENWLGCRDPTEAGSAERPALGMRISVRHFGERTTNDRVGTMQRCQVPHCPVKCGPT